MNPVLKWVITVLIILCFATIIVFIFDFPFFREEKIEIQKLTYKVLFLTLIGIIGHITMQLEIKRLKAKKEKEKLNK